ncbi:hypothetical protein [Synechococcus elongatus]|uniref:Uncharacterized protein n=1 Tax=Synechococcus elongatus PCC 11801 TaxID=2219813 RepID=A0AAQ3MCL3_SYNEL|nr:hypothetical protein [Synechococcus elongatus]
MSLPIFYSDRLLDLDTGTGHPERPERLTTTVVHLRSPGGSVKMKKCCVSDRSSSYGGSHYQVCLSDLPAE